MKKQLNKQEVLTYFNDLKQTNTKYSIDEVINLCKDVKLSEDDTNEVIQQLDISDDNPVNEVETLREFRNMIQIEVVDYAYKDSLQQYLNDAYKYERLSDYETNFLAKLAKKGDIEARNAIVNSNLFLAFSQAIKYRNCGLPLIDLVQEANIGLIKAAERYDETKGFMFSTYAVVWIKQSILRAIANDGRMIRLPVHLTDKITKMNKVSQQILDKTGEEPTLEEVAEAMNVSIKDLKKLQNLATVTTSLDKTIDDEEKTTLGELIPDTSTDSIDKVIDAKELHQMIQNSFSTLTNSSKTVSSKIMLHFLKYINIYTFDTKL